MCIRDRLGTCWLGAGFYPDIINRNVDLQTDEAVHCVISIGKANLPAFAPKRKELVKVCGMDEAQLGQLGAWPVSYTHLDVYKRQARGHGV